MTTDEKRRRAKSLRDKGKTYQEIGDVLGVSRSRAERLVNGNQAYDPEYERKRYLKRAAELKRKREEKKRGQ